MTEEKLFKVLRDGKSAHSGDLAWSLPTPREDGSFKPGAWHEVDGELAICERGLHLTTDPWDKWMVWGGTVYEAEAAGIADWDGDKCVARRARLLRPAPVPEWWREAERFVNETIPAVPWFRPDGNPDPAWRLFTAKTLAAAARAASDAAYDAAARAAYDAAYGAASRAATLAAYGAASDAATRAAYDAASRAGSRAAYGAASDAALFLSVNIVCADLDLAAEHRATAQQRWDAWCRGWGVAGEAGGVLYAYAAEPAGKDG